MSEPLVTIAELAEVLKVSPSTVYVLARSGDIPSMRVGNRWRFDVDAVLAKLADPKPMWHQSNRSRARKRKA